MTARHQGFDLIAQLGAHLQRDSLAVDDFCNPGSMLSVDLGGAATRGGRKFHGYEALLGHDAHAAFAMRARPLFPGAALRARKARPQKAHDHPLGEERGRGDTAQTPGLG
ncbi:MAG: hypothetical protein ACK55I_43320, partial [bacterium]